MVKNIFCFVCALALYVPVLAFSSSSAVNEVPAQRQERGFFEKLEALKNKAVAETQDLKQLGTPRIVSKGRKPEIIIKDEFIYFNGKKLFMGASLQAWKNGLAGSPRCSKDGIVICVWEEYGLQLGTGEGKDPKVKFINIYLSFVDEDGKDLGRENYPGGKAALPTDDWQVHEAFPGYLELDGYGIDANSKFWEIKAGTKNKRELRCGIKDCATPRGAFGDRGELQFRLNGSRETSTIRKFSVSLTGEE
ncbi:hypothetical protein SAMN05428959_1011422 [Duganella sp. CF517]|nr:hypothetical protein SAMN05428959_1011422 [Duganella sp. CF517]